MLWLCFLLSGARLVLARTSLLPPAQLQGPPKAHICSAGWECRVPVGGEGKNMDRKDSLNAFCPNLKFLARPVGSTQATLEESWMEQEDSSTSVYQ